MRRITLPSFMIQISVWGSFIRPIVLQCEIRGEKAQIILMPGRLGLGVGSVHQAFGFSAGQPADHYVMGRHFSPDHRLAQVLRKWGHLRLGLTEELSSLVGTPLPKQTHRAKKARRARNVLILASRLPGNGEGLF